jgi:magnesium-transporting ATPase (P-type)
MAKNKKIVKDKRPQSVFTLFALSKELVMQNLPIFAVVFGIPLFFSVVSSVNQPTNQSMDKFPSFSPEVAALVAITIVVSVLFAVMAVGLTLHVAKKQTPTFSDLWEFSRIYFLRMLGLWLLMFVIIGVGLIAFIVPGLIFLRRYFLAPYVLVDKGLSIVDSLKESARISKPFSKSVWTLIGLSIAISLIANPVFNIVGIVLSSILSLLFSVAPALRYYELKKLVK